MPHTLRIVSAQLNLHVGDIQQNLQKHIAAAMSARDQHHADLIIFPELSLTGYPPEDLLLRSAFISECEQALRELTANVRGIHCLIGHPVAEGKHLYNSCSLVYDGRILATAAKCHLPNYGVFDEKRYFKSKNQSCIVDIKGVRTGILICEDIWSAGPMEKTALAGAQVVLVPNASPFVKDKHEQRLNVLAKHAIKHQLPIVYVNNVGGQDELVFDGGSMIMSATGQMSHFCGFFNEQLMPAEIYCDHPHTQILPPEKNLPVADEMERVYQALVTGTRDYIEKNKFPGVLIGLSGGIDSALTAAIAVDALGHERVHGVFMPSRYTAEMSANDVAALSTALNIASTTLSIEPAYREILATLGNTVHAEQPGITEQNIQARCRSVLVMALSNATGKLVLTTGNRSELAVGYCTLYGDMSGGYAVLKNVPKTLVYKLAAYRNALGHVIPENILHREPTAELAPNQKDQDSLPPYSELDAILDCYLDQSMSIAEIVGRGLPQETVVKVVNLIRRNEYKRKQYAVGPQIQEKSFIKDWRYPVTNGFEG